jgi:hypothetical protein
MDDFMAGVTKCAQEYEEQYKPELVKRQQDRSQQEQQRQAAELERLRADRTADGDIAAAAAASMSRGSGKTVLDGRKGAALQRLAEEEEAEGVLD